MHYWYVLLFVRSIFWRAHLLLRRALIRPSAVRCRELSECFILFYFFFTWGKWFFTWRIRQQWKRFQGQRLAQAHDPEREGCHPRSRINQIRCQKSAFDSRFIARRRLNSPEIWDNDTWNQIKMDENKSENENKSSVQRIKLNYC